MNTPTVHTPTTATLARRYVALDLETTTLDRRFAVPLEVAAVEFDPRDSGVYMDVQTFVPFHTPEALHAAEPEALTVNRYYERRLYDDMLDPADTAAAADKLIRLLSGSTLVCANPAYDSMVLWSWLSNVAPDLGREPWHHRLYDVSLATAVELGLNSIPGLATCAKLWNLDTTTGPDSPHGGWHSAAFDAFAAADVCAAVHRATQARTAAAAMTGGQNGRGGVL